MGYVIHPIPREVLLAMPDDLRRKVLAAELASMKRIYAQQAGTAEYGIGMLAAVIIGLALWATGII